MTSKSTGNFLDVSLRSSGALFSNKTNLLDTSNYQSRSIGEFTVSTKGELSIDYLFDGGQGQGELAIFSTEGLNKYRNITALTKEIARRALSNSSLGHVVISDNVEGARFGGNEYASGANYRGAKMFSMNPGTSFGVMFVPDATVQQVYDNPKMQVLYSIDFKTKGKSRNRNQMVDVTGNGNTFAFEETPLDRKADRDYNDIVFRVQGALTKATSLKKAINKSYDWRQSNLGRALVNYSNPNVTATHNYDFPTANQPLIGIIDTGFSEKNPDIDYNRIILGSDRLDDDKNPLLSTGDGNEHGTHVLGIIGATKNNGIGIDGINDKAPIWLGRAIGSGNWAGSLREFVDYAKQSGHKNAVVNLSFDLVDRDSQNRFTTRYQLTSQERREINYARNNGVLIVVAAGNDSGVMSALGQSSQEFDNIITVGASDNNQRASYSNYGYGLDILAPGGTADNPVLSLVGDSIGTMSGTSISTAQVTGAISQLWAANPGLNYRQVINVIKQTATDLGTPNWDIQTGMGLLNFQAAVELAKHVRPQPNQLPMLVDLNDSLSLFEGITPLERAVGFNYPVINETFSGWVAPSVGINVRNGPSEKDRKVGGKTYKTNLTFDAWTYGDVERDMWNGQQDALWYRIAGTDTWVSGAYIAGYPNSRPSVLPSAQNSGSQTTPPSSDILNYNGKQYRWVNYKVKAGDTLSQIALNTLGNGTQQAYNIISQRNGINPDKIRQGQDIVIPKLMTNNDNQQQTGSTNSLVDTVPSTMRSFASQSIPLIVKTARENGVTNPAQIAYILATAQQESNLGQDMEEIADGSQYEGRLDLGNTESGDGIRFKGRGFVQITGRSNYKKFSQVLGIDLVANPNLAAQPDIAAKILVLGMRDGSFTGVGLNNYINNGLRDFYNARRIVNVTDKASYIAQVAQRYLNVFNNSGDGGGSTTSEPVVTNRNEYTVQFDDTLWGIAQRILGSGERAKEIRKADGTEFSETDTRSLAVGTKVYLPVVNQLIENKPVNQLQQNKPIELIDPTLEKENDWIIHYNPDPNRNKYWSTLDSDVVFGSWSSLKDLQVGVQYNFPFNLKAIKAEEVAQKIEDNLKDFFNIWNLPFADKHMEHFLNQGDSTGYPLHLGTLMDDIPVDEMLQYVPGFQKEYDARINQVKSKLAQYSDKLKQNSKRIKPGHYWINPESSQLWTYSPEHTWIYNQSKGIDMGRKLSQGIDLFEKLTGDLNGNFLQIINAPYHTRRLLDFYNAIGRFEYNTSIEVIINEDSSISLKTQMYVHDYFNFDIKLNELLSKSNQFKDDWKKLSSWGLRFSQSAVPEILVKLGMANNYEQWGISSVREFNV